MLITLALIAIAIVGKLGGAAIAARVMRRPWRESAVIGTLMNTRGLTELIVLNLALDVGAISQALFAALVIMALVTTFMTGPLLRLLDPRQRLRDAESRTSSPSTRGASRSRTRPYRCPSARSSSRRRPTRRSGS